MRSHVEREKITILRGELLRVAQLRVVFKEE
jgi:hypothetical protein